MPIKVDVQEQEVLSKLSYVYQKVELRVAKALKQGVQAVKRHLIAMTSTRLARRSGALQKSVSGALVGVRSGGPGRLDGTLTVIGIARNRRGTPVSRYLGTHFGKGKKTINAKTGMLAIPIKGGPANAFTGRFSTLATASPKDMPGIMVRIGQVLYAGQGKSRDLYPAFVLKPRVVIPRRVDPQDAVNEAQMEILENFRGLVESVN